MATYRVTLSYSDSIEWEADSPEQAVREVLDTDFGTDITHNNPKVEVTQL